MCTTQMAGTRTVDGLGVMVPYFGALKCLYIIIHRQLLVIAAYVSDNYDNYELYEHAFVFVRFFDTFCLSKKLLRFFLQLTFEARAPVV